MTASGGEVSDHHLGFTVKYPVEPVGGLSGRLCVCGDGPVFRLRSGADSDRYVMLEACGFPDEAVVFRFGNPDDLPGFPKRAESAA